MKPFKCYNCGKEVKWVVSDEGNYFWACDCARFPWFYTLDKPFQWRHKDYKERKAKGKY